ncbi:hypothetical protein GpartN1_g1248.t1 [Galdieria partita]|uniref:30S ribosomal protein S5, chloroplastic n=1 Tax=Galdieria partita TaxID=83374 RepID=A0A9C7UNL0_9RHOD|nr:hypothetical protein GpartN1_g1248.t1 [Galdieria partita]
MLRVLARQPSYELATRLVLRSSKIFPRNNFHKPLQEEKLGALVPKWLKSLSLSSERRFSKPLLTNVWCTKRFCASDSGKRSAEESLSHSENSSNHTLQRSGGIPVFGKEESDPSQLGRDYVRLISLLVRMPELIDFSGRSYVVGDSSLADSFDDPEAISRLERTRAELLARSIAEKAGFRYDEIFEAIREIEFSNFSDKSKFLPIVYIPMSAVDLEQQAELYRCIDSLRTLFTMLDVYGEVPFPCAAWIDGEPVKPASEADYLREIGSETESPELIRARRQLEDTIIPSRVLRGFEAKLLELRRTARVTRGGTVWSYRAFVVVGNYEGTAGYGMGKSASPRHAVSLAIRDSMKHMIHVERYQDRTIYHPLDFTFKASRVLVFPGRTGKGIHSGPLFTVVLTVFGFQDISARMMGSHNRINTVKALFGALSTHRTVKEIAAIRGVNYIDLGITNKEDTKERSQYMEFL